MIQMGTECRGRVVVLGVGNELFKDEGIGVHVVRELARQAFTFEVEIIEAGTVPDCWQGDKPVSRLVVIDAVHGGGEPGAIYKFSPEDVDFGNGMLTSNHQLSFLDSLKIGEITGCKPEKTVIIGIEPKEIAWGTELSDQLRDRIPEIVKIVLQEVSPEPETGLMRDGHAYH
ncbi:Ni,Fe-hydrogenase maturation factor (hup operon) [Syntrophobacter sp. SbD1]|nr:Ni,Fe-hydrogenase maturation factor (hup operon) [Syntrophobacter sp. SbD1]